MNKLPDEILLQVFIHCQPHFVLELDSLWLEPTHCTPDSQTWTNSETGKSLILSDDTMWDAKGYHSTIKRSYFHYPILQVVSSVSRKWNRVAAMHPFYSTLSWHYLIPKPLKCKSAQFTSDWLKIARSLDVVTRNSRTIHLDLDRFNLSILPEDLLYLFLKLQRPHIVATLVISTSWITIGDPCIIKFICTCFPNLTRLYLRGQPFPGILHGLDNKALLSFSKSLHGLTHLFLGGYGGGSFSFKGLSRLLVTNSSITTLSLGYVRNGIDLNKLGIILPHLHRLTIQFETIVTAPDLLDEAMATLAMLSRAPVVHECVPILIGNLKNLTNLGYLAFFEADGPSFGISRLVIEALLSVYIPETLTLNNGIIRPK